MIRVLGQSAGLITFRRMTNTRGDLELERRSPLWGPGTIIILLTPLYYLDLYTTNICLRCLSLALVHAGKAELGLLVFILMDGRRTPTHSNRCSHVMFITVKFMCYQPNLDARQYNGR